ncbi:conserved hypothetical protein [Culex quinquefasciatus]|uniref:V-SNARE coiled-coil homology domain-containing protein n=1 Tax=Culex quinquefasciatus TaxID=7176 RepID=B0XAS2_CULQU|nr:conserved hypothetical protein [Culex quinquefasciatus]|eukprot:XP_001866744.1 conserved hypothetical protein [Culex quinquefasciatus]
MSADPAAPPAESAPDGLAPGAAGEPGADGIVGGPRTPQQIAAQKRLQQTQAQVDEVVDIMKTNVEKVLERDQKLSELDDRADALQQGASQFEQQAGKLKRKFWLQNLKVSTKFMPAEQPQQPMMMMPQQPMQQMPMQVQAPAAAPAALVQDIASLVSNQHQFKN